MARFYLFIGLLSLALFSWAQYRGVGLFDETAASQTSRLSPAARTTFHK